MDFKGDFIYNKGNVENVKHWGKETKTMELSTLGLQNRAEWEAKGYKLPKFDREAVTKATNVMYGLLTVILQTENQEMLK